jgi:putative tryptophan/tyrosine transport system substrate-binding protein
MKEKKSIAILIIGLIVVVSFSGCVSEQKPKVYHVGILSGLNLFSSIADSFKAELTRLGYVENQTIFYDFQRTNYEPEREKQILDTFVNDKVDLIFGFNTEVALEAKEATKGTGIPLVFANTFTEGNTLIENISHPGGNITGVRYPSIDVAVKRLEILHELVPQAQRIWLPYQQDYPAIPSELEILTPAAAALNLTIIEFSSKNLTHLQTELEQRSHSGDIGFDAVLLIPESLSTTKAAFQTIANFTRDQKIPVGGSRIVTDDYGTLFAVTVNNTEIGIQAAHLADKVFRGIPAGTIPVVSPETHIVINIKVAQELGINVSEGLLVRADEVIH